MNEISANGTRKTTKEYLILDVHGDSFVVTLRVMLFCANSAKKQQQMSTIEVFISCVTDGRSATSTSIKSA